jgi:hypothetical protein
MKYLRFVAAFVLLSFAIRPSALAHPADQSEMRVRPSPHALEIRFTFNILTLTRFVRIDTDGDMKISMAELAAAERTLTEYLNGHIRLDINQETAALGSNVKFAYLWPDAQASPPMTDFEYSGRNMDVTFVLPVEKQLLEDFWIGFEIFEQTGPMQTIRGLFEQDGEVLEVPFSGQEPEYTYDTGFADDPFVQEAEMKAAAAQQPAKVEWPLWLLAPAFLVLIALYRSTIARRLRTSR